MRLGQFDAVVMGGFGMGDDALPDRHRTLGAAGPRQRPGQAALEQKTVVGIGLTAWVK
jgi:hypothetical protein